MMADSVSIALCTDTHTWQMEYPIEGNDGSRIFVDHAETLHALLMDDLRAAQVDMAVHLGDMTNGGGFFGMPADAFALQIERLARAWRQLPFPVHALPGNHDCSPGGSDLLPVRSGGGSGLGDGWGLFERLWDLEPGLGRTIDLGVAVLVLVHTQGHTADQVAEALPDDPVYGWVSERELARVAQALTAAGDRPVVLAMHQLLRPWQAGRAWRDYYGIGNGDRLLDLMARAGNVRAVFQGHAHFYEVQESRIGGRACTFVIAPAVVESPTAWLRLNLDATGMQVVLQRLPAELATPPGQEWRAGHKAWRNWRLAW